jgi:hypothetical protein
VEVGRISIRNLVAAAALAVCAAGPSHAQALAEFALVLVLNDQVGTGPTLVGIQPSAALAGLCEAPGPDAEALCAALDELAVGMPATAAVAKFGGGLQRFVFEPLTETASKPLLVIAEDVEGEALGVTLGRQPEALADDEDPSRESRVLYTMLGEGGLELVTCAYRGRHELEHVVQQRAGIGAADAEDGGPCADALQEALDAGQELGFATALADVDATGPPFDAAEPSDASRGRIFMAYLTVQNSGVPPPGPGALADDVAILSCDVGADGPLVHGLQTADTGFCDDGSHLDYCAAVDAIAAGQPCAGALSSLLEVGASLIGTPAAVPAVDRSSLLILREADVLAIARDPASRSGSNDLLFGLRGDGEPRLLACDFSRPEPVVTFEQPEPAESSVGEACATALVRGWDASQKVQIEPVARSVVGFGTFSFAKRMPRTASDDPLLILPGNRVVYTIVVPN